MDFAGSRRNTSTVLSMHFSYYCTRPFRRAHLSSTHPRHEAIDIFISALPSEFSLFTSRTVALRGYFSDGHFGQVSTSGIYAGVFLSAWWRVRTSHRAVTSIVYGEVRRRSWFVKYLTFVSLTGNSIDLYTEFVHNGWIVNKRRSASIEEIKLIWTIKKKICS